MQSEQVESTWVEEKAQGHGSARRRVQLFLLLSAVLLGVALWRSEMLPPPSALKAALFNEPVQRPDQTAPFQVVSHQITYTISPLFSYDLSGLVVSKHNADSWWDYIHRESNDHINVTDLCVIWGNNARNGAYQEFTFFNQQFTCNIETRSEAAYAAFDQTAVSNNHLLTVDKRLARLMRNVRVGDQVHFRGYLAVYSHHQGFAFRRGTSTVRTDTGNGACETVYVEDFEIIKSGNKFWRLLVWVAAGMLVLGVVGWFRLPVKHGDEG